MCYSTIHIRNMLYIKIEWELLCTLSQRATVIPTVLFLAWMVLQSFLTLFLSWVLTIDRSKTFCFYLKCCNNLTAVCSATPRLETMVCFETIFTYFYKFRSDHFNSLLNHPSLLIAIRIKTWIFQLYPSFCVLNTVLIFILATELLVFNSLSEILLIYDKLHICEM